jgi:hypothetical protein
MMRTQWASKMVFTVAVLLATATLSSAQTAAELRSATPSFEVGTTVGALAIFPTFGARATVALSPRFAIEGSGEYVPWVLDDAGGQHFILQGQLRHTFHRGDRWNWHATYGGTFYTKVTDAAFSEQRSFRVDNAAVHLGIGAEHPISAHVAFRWDAQAAIGLTERNYPIPQGSIGITWK